MYSASQQIQRFFKVTDLTGVQIRLSWILRITAALCFIGHGAWGLITKAGWVPFYAVAGISEPIAWKLMPLTGAFDILMAILLLIKPRRIILLWMGVWAIWTALIRPLAGMSFWEVWERAGNYGPPFVLLLLAGSVGVRSKDWWGAMKESALTEERLDTMVFILKVSLALLLIGHGGFGVFLKKQMLVDHFSAIGISATPQFLVAIGLFEMTLGTLVLFKPLSLPLLGVVLIWKLGTELLYPIAGGVLDIFEFIERWGDYGIPVALMVVSSYYLSKKETVRKESRPRKARTILVNEGT